MTMHSQDVQTDLQTMRDIDILQGAYKPQDHPSYTDATLAVAKNILKIFRLVSDSNPRPL